MATDLADISTPIYPDISGRYIRISPRYVRIYWVDISGPEKPDVCRGKPRYIDPIYPDISGRYISGFPSTDIRFCGTRYIDPIYPDISGRAAWGWFGGAVGVFWGRFCVLFCLSCCLRFGCVVLVCWVFGCCVLRVCCSVVVLRCVMLCACDECWNPVVGCATVVSFVFGGCAVVL